MSSDIIPVDKTALAQGAKTAEEALAALRAAPCLTQEQEDQFRAIGERAHLIIKTDEDERKALVKPHNDVVDEINEAFRPKRVAFQAVKDLAKEKISERQSRLALEAQAAKERAFVAPTPEAVAEALAEVPQVTATSWEWVCVIEDPLLVPRDFLRVCDQKTAAYCKSYAKSQVIPEVPGLCFERRAKVRL